MTAWRCTAALIVLTTWSAVATGHEVRPALLQVVERSDHRFDFLWKQPSQGVMAVHLVPHISGGLLEAVPSAEEATPDFEIRRWRNVDVGRQGLAGRTLNIEGLDRTITDVLVSITLADGISSQQIVEPRRPTLALQIDEPTRGASDFVVLGIRHILTGPDHLAFLCGLLLIVRNRWMLVKTVSAFTLAHSMTLAIATLAHLALSTPLLDTLIALSILFIAPEAIHARRGGSSLAIRHPWVVAFAFGLVHGMGFAGGLAPLGLTRSALLTALLEFNVGVELGQLAFVVVVLTLQRCLRQLPISWPRAIELAPSYLIGSCGAFWTFQCGAAAMGII